MPYLFVHFKEKLTVDGEQVYFAVSSDGYHFDSLNGGNPVLTASLGEKGCRDIEIVRLQSGGFVLLTTDLCIVNRMDENHNVDWSKVNSSGSKCLRMWKTNDLVNFSKEELVHFGRDDFGCMWAPEVFYDEKREEYLIHWGSTVASDNFKHMSIYSSTTKDFVTFSKPKIYFSKENEILDSHIQKVGDTYHLFYKNAQSPSMNMHSVSNDLYGEFEHDEKFEQYMASFEKPGSYEAPTVYTLPDGKWCMMLDFFGCEKEKMGYVPFVSSRAGDTNFERADSLFSFPYGFKHGRVIEISKEEEEKLRSFYSSGEENV